MLLKLLLLILALFRIFIAVMVETPLLVQWPVSNLAATCPVVCPQAWQSEWCFKHCEARQKIQLDLAEYEKVDPLFAGIVGTPQLKLNMYILVGISVGILLVAFGTILGSRYARKWGLWFSGVLFMLIAPYCVQLYQASPKPELALLYNAGDILLILVLLWNGLTGDHAAAVAPAVKTSQATTAAAKKKN